MTITVRVTRLDRRYFRVRTNLAEESEDRIGAKLPAAAIVLVGVVVLAKESASATADGVWPRSDTWPTNGAGPWVVRC